MVALVPYASFLGLSFEKVDGEWLTIMPFSEHIVGNPTVPALHGGAIASLLESASIAAALLSSDASSPLPRPVTLTFDYLRPGRPILTRASARVVRRGRRVCTVHATAWQEDRDKPIATANATLLVG